MVEKIGMRIRELRYQRGLSIEELAQMANVSQSTIRSIEKK